MDNGQVNAKALEHVLGAFKSDQFAANLLEDYSAHFFDKK